MPGHAGHKTVKDFPPLESDPFLFTKLLHKLGGSGSLHFEDVLSLDPSLLPTLIPGHILAFVLISPTNGPYQFHASLDQEPERVASLTDAEKTAAAEDVIWLKQTIRNACGFYALLHAFLNIPSGNTAEAGSFLDIVSKASSTEDRMKICETSKALEDAYIPVALEGQTAVADNWAEEPPFHYVCFIGRKGRVWELEGARLGPMIRGQGDCLQEVIEAVGRSVKEHGEGAFSLLALVDGH